jgi:hypothetical protein
MTFARGLVVAALPLFAVAVWLMFHNPTIHGVRLNSSGDSTHVGDWTCLAPYDITLFHTSNEYGGNEVADSDYARTHCNCRAQELCRGCERRSRWCCVRTGRSRPAQ